MSAERGAWDDPAVRQAVRETIAAERGPSGTGGTATTCGMCGTILYDAGEYHPHAFCVLKLAGLDPWQTVRIIAAQLQIGDPGEKPPLLTETHHA